MKDRVVYVNRADPEFSVLADWEARGMEIVNAPRPLPAQHEWVGPFRHGVFYAASDPDMAELIRTKWDSLHASRLVLVDNEQIKRLVTDRIEAAGESIDEILECWGSWSKLARVDGWPWSDVMEESE